MRTARRVLKNSIALLTATLLERGIAFVITWYIARTLGKGILGEYSTAQSWLFVSLPLALWGFDQLLLREAARNRDKLDQYLVNAGVVIIAASAATALILNSITLLFDYPASLGALLRIISFWVIPFYAGSIWLETAIKSLERMEWITIVRTPLSIIRVGISVYLLWQGRSLEVVFWVLGGYYAVTCFFYFRILCAYIPRFNWTIQPAIVKGLAVQAIPFLLIGIFGVTFKQVDRIILSALAPMDLVGLYAAGATVMAMVLLLAPAMMESLFPGLSRMHLSARHHLQEAVGRLIRLIWFVTLPMTFAVITLVRPAVLLLFSADYVTSVGVAQILALAIVPAFLTRLLYRVLLATNNERTTLRVAAINSAIGITLNLILIPWIGLTGAALAVVGAETAGFLQNLTFVHRHIVRISLWQTLAKPAICTVFCGLIYAWIYPWNAYVALTGALAVFVLIVYLWRILSVADFHDLGERSLVRA